MSEQPEPSPKLKRLREFFTKAAQAVKTRHQKLCNATKNSFKNTQKKWATPLTDTQKQKREIWTFRAGTTLAMGFCIYSATLWSDDPKTTTAHLEKNGITHVSTYGYKTEPTKCGLHEPFRVAFSGIRNNQWVTGVVCKNGLSKKRVTIDQDKKP
jgi:hypothetical protein